MRKIIVLSCIAILASAGVFADGNTTPIKPTPTTPINTTPTHTTTPVKNVPKGLIILNDFYAVDEDFVYSINDVRTAWVKMPTADRTNFTVVRGQFARDVDQVFYRGKKIEGVDVASFSVISAQYGYSQDDKHVFGPEGVIKDADVDTFKMITGVYSLDAGHVYAHAKMIEADSGSFRVIKDGLYAVDDKQVFYDGKLLPGISPDKFVVKGPRAFDREGRVFFEGRIERGTMPTITDPENPPVTPENPTTPEEPIIEPSVNIFTPYMAYLTGNTSFWSLVVLGLLGLLSILFVFFAERNDEEVTLWKVFVKFIISVLVAAGIMWIVSLFASAKVALIAGIIIGFFFYISLWSVLGWIKSFLITVLSLIALAFFLAAIALASRFFFDDISQVLDFVTSIAAQRLMVIGVIGTFIGAVLIVTQLGSSFIRSFGQSLGATLIALVVVAFLAWINPLGTVSTVVLFTVLFAILLWIMRFRIVSNLFVETIRIVRVALILAVVIGVIIWIVL